MVWPHNWTEEEFERRTAALDAILDLHLGPAMSADAFDADYVLTSLVMSHVLGAMRKSKEREALAQLRSSARDLSEAWRSLHPDTRAQIWLMSEKHTRRENEEWKHEEFSLGMLSVLDKLVEVTLPIATETINAAPEAGRRKLDNVAAVEALRKVWEQRKGVEAPNSMNEAGAFADFMISAFQAMGLKGSPRAAIDSWRKFRAKHHLSD